MPSRAVAYAIPQHPARLEVLTVQEVAAELKCSEQTVANRFQDLPGVFDVGSGKRQALRIPRHVLNAWIEDRSRGFSMKPGKGRV